MFWCLLISLILFNFFLATPSGLVGSQFSDRRLKRGPWQRKQIPTIGLPGNSPFTCFKITVLASVINSRYQRTFMLFFLFNLLKKKKNQSYSIMHFDEMVQFFISNSKCYFFHYTEILLCYCNYLKVVKLYAQCHHSDNHQKGISN